MKPINHLLALLACLLVLPLSAQQLLTREQCREMALENNKQMAIAAESRKKAGYDTKSYRTHFFPKLSATGNYLLTSASVENSIPGNYLPTFVPDANGQLVPNILTTVDGIPLFKEYAYFPDMDLNLKLNNTYMAGLRLEQPIYMGGKISSAYRMAKIGEEMAELNEVKSRTEVILQADEAYWTYLQTLELEKTTRSYQQLVEHLLRDIENAYSAGMKPRNDLLKVQVKRNEVELQVLRAENAVRLSRMNLCHVIGLPLTTEITAGDTLDEQVEEYLPLPEPMMRPEYELLSKQIELKEQEIKLVRSDYLPNIGVAGNLGYANGLTLNGSRLLDRTAFSAIISVNIPLFHWGEGDNKVRSARAEKNRAIFQRDDLVEKMELELQQAQNQLEEAKMEVKLASRSLAQAEENQQESRNRYDAGMETLSDHLEAQTLWQQAASELIRARTAAQLAETRYLKAAGRL